MNTDRTTLHDGVLTYQDGKVMFNFNHFKGKTMNEISDENREVWK